MEDRVHVRERHGRTNRHDDEIWTERPVFLRISFVIAELPLEFPFDIDHGVRPLVNEWILVFNGDRNRGAALIGIERRGGDAFCQFTFDRDDASDLPGRQWANKAQSQHAAYERSNIHNELIG